MSPTRPPRSHLDVALSKDTHTKNPVDPVIRNFQPTDERVNDQKGSSKALLC